MRKIIITTFVSLDGIMQAPGGREEDTSGGFTEGGWSMAYWDDAAGKVMNDFMAQPFELLLGRKTYDIFAGYWPTSTEEPVASAFNGTKKHVVSHEPKELSWAGSELVTGDVPAELRRLKEVDGPDLWVHGSGNLIQTLLKEELVDRMHIWTIPVTIGHGKRLFAEGTKPREWRLTDSLITSMGVIIATYEPSGDIKYRPID